jgi:hypothetical protein
MMLLLRFPQGWATPAQQVTGVETYIHKYLHICSSMTTWGPRSGGPRAAAAAAALLEGWATPAQQVTGLQSYIHTYDQLAAA